MADGMVKTKEDWSSKKDNKLQEENEEQEVQQQYLAHPKRSLHPSRTNKNGLPAFIKKQLLLDIEYSGGIAYGDDWQLPSKISNLLNKRPDIYGLPGSDLREKVYNKLRTWKKSLSQAEYYELLENSGIHQAARLPAANHEDSYLSPQLKANSSTTTHPTAGGSLSHATPSKGTPSKRRESSNQMIMSEPSPLDNLQRKFSLHLPVCCNNNLK
jgi:hypothetical protein